MDIKNSRKKPVFIFDIGGVLINWNPRYLFRKFFKDDEAGMEHFLAKICSQEWNIKQDLGRSIEEGTEERIALFPDYEAPIRAYYGRYNETVMGDFPGTVAILADLRDAGYTLTALSNWSSETFSLIYDRFEFLDWFEDIVVSGDVGLIKPDPAIYQLTLERIGYKPEECLFIDDSQANVDAALAQGIDAIRFESAQKLAQELRDRGLLA